ncbi:hypothetical protein K1719_017278 [Acacia pycnantha]|nr:hypothetical protein K1719_017278 [Acacia pycnantha]
MNNYFSVQHTLNSVQEEETDTILSLFHFLSFSAQQIHHFADGFVCPITSSIFASSFSVFRSFLFHCVLPRFDII